jgi:hypothetical protein
MVGVFHDTDEDMMFAMVVEGNPHLAGKRKIFKLHSHAPAGPIPPVRPVGADKKAMAAYKRQLTAFNKKVKEVDYNTEAVVSMAGAKQTIRYRCGSLSGIAAAYKENFGEVIALISDEIPKEWTPSDIVIHLQDSAAEFFGVPFHEVEIDVSTMTREEYFALKEIKIRPKRTGSAVLLPEEPYILQLKHESART